ncbi:sensor domain-containing diguanylate cyclase/phosphohydrolase [Conexibacter arvalis]|uniref:Diguanylate cyclase (GGDEF)-like protein/putative nucleotidyltransferase with HDIG domain n=1 Tax=Conexibacter arvalis TaxID=912552 RepID=A0A840IML8_9ACTN|nr:diguanylate cyclase [Conexibacter arvalis]MBB4665244.1 diguanylate cyclase (GGDEF)-like protein/putative nucleotidyltransferase with HDIG domain [Conexibacter arvalis]
MGPPADEEERDTLERLTRVAARALAVPVALVAVRDGAGGDGHLLAAATGLPPTWQPGAALDDALPGAAALVGDGPLVVADLRATPRLREGSVIAALGAVSCMAVALRDRTGAARGAICVLDVRARAWSDEERDQLADLAAVAAHEHLRAADVRERRALRHVAMAVARGADPAAVHELVAGGVAYAYGAEAGAVVRYEDDRTARVVGTWSAPGIDGLPLDGMLGLEDGGIAAALRRGKPARASGGPGHRPFRHRVGAPVHQGGRVWGFVTALSGGAAFPPEAEQRLADFAELVTAALVNAEARDQLAALATTDPLTGLANQRAFQERLAGECERARRHGRNLGLALIDLDGFKFVNDAHGHQAGDDALTTVARRAASTIRAGELLARLGGDELALLLPEADAGDTYAAAERIRQLIANEPIGPSGSITISVGVSDLALGGDADGLMRTADDALYWAKAQGRNVVAQYVPELRDQLGSEERADRVTRRQALLGIGALARAVDAREGQSEGHSERVAELAVRLARAAGWPAQRLALLREAALVHDVGKIGVPEHLLGKATLTPAEASQLREHARLGADIAGDVLTPEQVAWIRSHHERPDGLGYPDGLAAEAIPLGARLLAVADAWDAMTCPRGGRRPLGTEQALAECRAGAGSQFAPEAVAALERVLAAGEMAPAWTATSAISLGA